MDAKRLQLRWTDEPPDRWRTVGTLADGSPEGVEAALAEARASAKETDARYPHHTFTAEFRVI